MPVQDGNIGTFDGLDNRRELLILFDKLGHGLDEQRAGMRRAMFLRGLLDEAAPEWQGKALRVDPCSSVDAYFLLVALVSGFGVRIEEAAKKLDRAVRAVR